MNSPFTHAYFDLAAPPAPAPLAWTGSHATPVDAGVRDSLAISDVHVEGITPGVPIGSSDKREPCEYSLALRMRFTNQGAERLSFPSEMLLLLDSKGRSLKAYANAPYVELAPRSTVEATVLFPAVREASDPWALYISADNFKSFVLVKIQSK